MRRHPSAGFRRSCTLLYDSSPCRRRSVCPVQIVPDKRCRPFAKQKTVPPRLGLDARLQVGTGTDLHPGQVDEEASAGSGAVSKPGIRTSCTLRSCRRYPLTTCPALGAGGGRLGDWGRSEDGAG
jgi:hypothetical protein